MADNCLTYYARTQFVVNFSTWVIFVKPYKAIICSILVRDGNTYREIQPVTLKLIPSIIISNISYKFYFLYSFIFKLLTVSQTIAEKYLQKM